MVHAFSHMSISELPKDGGLRYLQSLYQALDPWTAAADGDTQIESQSPFEGLANYSLATKPATASMMALRLLISPDRLLSPALPTCLSRRLPHLAAHELLQLNIYDTDHITSFPWNLLLPKQGSSLRERWQLGLLPLPHSPHYLTSSSVHSASWISLLSSRLSLSPLSAVCCRLPPSVACLGFLSGLLASQPAILHPLPTWQPV